MSCAAAPCDSLVIRELLTRLDYQFRDARLLQCALTHRSAAADHNERLEFLGDAVIELVVTEWLFRALPRRSEGELTRLRARVVRRESLAEHARALGLGDALSLGSGELKSGGRHRDSILADALEALVGAIYLDAGFEESRRVLTGIVSPHLESLSRTAATKDPKTQLQEWLQGRGLPLPEYAVVRTEGVEHAQRFVVSCSTGHEARAAQGSGSSRRRAEQDAAKRLLDELERGRSGD